MLASVLALLLACSSPSPPPDAGIAAIDAHVHATHAASQALTTQGSAIANALVDIAEGKGTVAEVHASLLAARTLIDQQRAALATYDGPTRPELVAYQQAMDRYLAEQRRSLDTIVEEGLVIVQDESMPPIERTRALQRRLLVPAAVESQASDEIRGLMEALYATF